VLCLILHAGPERLAVPAAAVLEVLPAVDRHPVGGTDGAVRVRGRVVPVLDLCRAAGGTPCPHALHARLVVVDGPVGLLVERVGELRDVATTGLPAPVPGGGPDLGPLAADPDGVVRLTDPKRLLPPGWGPA
jgi:chemotaxis signal transduction protein